MGSVARWAFAQIANDKIVGGSVGANQAGLRRTYDNEESPAVARTPIWIDTTHGPVYLVAEGQPSLARCLASMRASDEG